MPYATGTKWCEPSREPHLNPPMPPPPAIAGRKAPRSSHLQLNGQSCERDLLLDFEQTETAAGQVGVVVPPAASWIGKPTQHTTSGLVHPSTIAIRRLAWQAACSSCISSDGLWLCLPHRLTGSSYGSSDRRVGLHTKYQTVPCNLPAPGLASSLSAPSRSAGGPRRLRTAQENHNNQHLYTHTITYNAESNAELNDE